MFSFGYWLQVTTLIAGHNCTSSARRRTTTPTSAWVASKAVVILRKHTNMGPKELWDKLQDDHKCVIHYDTVCKGRQIALKSYMAAGRIAFRCCLIGRLRS